MMVLSRAIAISLLTLVFPTISLAEVTFYVSPHGDDNWTGTLPEPNADKTDGPLATPFGAQVMARRARFGHHTEVIDLQFRGGIYHLHEPLTLTSDDSGSDHAPITWRAYPGETPIFSGGSTVTDWVKTTLNDRPAWKATLSNMQNRFQFRGMWISGHKAQRARWPKQGTLAVGDTDKIKPFVDWQRPHTAFPVVRGDIKPWPNLNNGEVILLSGSVDAHLPIERLDQGGVAIHSIRNADFHPETGDRYYVENVRETATEPGQWFQERGEHTVYLIMPEGMTAPNDTDIISPILPQVLRLQGDVNRPIQYVTFSGITFSHSEWSFDHVAPGQPGEGSKADFKQADFGVAGAVYCEGVRNCTFDHCTISHVGNYAFELGRGVQNNRITHCICTDLGAGGIKIGEPIVRDNPVEQTYRNVVSDCRITDGGNTFPSSAGIWIGQAHDNTISHNEIACFWHTGIALGWTWGYEPGQALDNTIEFNHIHHIGIKRDDDLPILSDMGGVYTLGDQTGTTIRNNVIHDVVALNYGGSGIYFDDGTTNALAENNLVYRTSHGGFHQHYGNNNLIRNNIFALGRDSQIDRNWIESHTSFTFKNNIVFWKTGQLLTGNWKGLGVEFDHNTYWNPGESDFLVGKHTWQDWQAAGMDKHSVIADPGFKDPEHGDFTVTSDLSKLGGFVSFDVRDVGPHKEAPPEP